MTTELPYIYLNTCLIYLFIYAPLKYPNVSTVWNVHHWAQCGENSISWETAIWHVSLSEFPVDANGHIYL